MVYSLYLPFAMYIASSDNLLHTVLIDIPNSSAISAFVIYGPAFTYLIPVISISYLSFLLAMCYTKEKSKGVFIMQITKSDIKILNYVHHRHFRPVTYMSLSGKFSKHEVDNLIKGELLSYVPVIVDYQGIPSEKLSAESAIFLTKDGIYVVEQNQWFDTQYLLTQIIVPILVGVASAVITTVLLQLL
nr:MAG TPA: hypothetical protein [Caudoviricetes sp.]